MMNKIFLSLSIIVMVTLFVLKASAQLGATQRTPNNNGILMDHSMCHDTGLQTDTSHSMSDSSNHSLLSHLGGDLFVSGDFFIPAHTFGVMGYDIGAEVRVSSFFLAVMRGEAVNGAGLRYIPTSIYGGALIGQYRLEIGGMYTTRGPGWNEDYTSFFLGANKRFGGILFVEPELRIMFPTVSRLLEDNDVTKCDRLRNLFFGISVKLGIGYN